MELNTLRARKFIENNKQDLTLPKFAEGTAPITTTQQYINVANQAAQQYSAQNAGSTTQTGTSGTTTTNTNTNVPKTNDADPNGAQAAAGAHPGFAIGAWLGGGALKGLNSVQRSGELLAQAGTADGTYAGIGYTRQNTLDANGLMDQYDKGTKKAWLTNPAEAIFRGLFGSDRQKFEIAKANQIANNLNQFNMAGAATQALQLNNLKKEGDYNNQVLYAKNGKLPGFVNGFDGRARLSNGEIYGHIDLFGNVLDMHKAGHGKDNKDTLIRNLGNSPEEVDRSFVVTNKRGWSDYVKAGGDVNIALQGMQSGAKAPGFKSGKMPGFAEGRWGNLIPSAIGAAASLGQILSASGEDLYAPNIYSANPYEQSALNDLAGLRINEYPILNRLNQQRAEADFGIDNSGGLGGGQRARIRSANLASTQRSIADAMINIQAQNNQYRSQLASAKMNLGAQRAQRQQAANQYRSEMLARAHGAKQQGIQTGISNLVAQIQNYYANDFKRRQFNETMDLYRQDQKMRQDELNAIIKRLNGDGNTSNATPRYTFNNTLTTPSMTYTPLQSIGYSIPQPTLTPPKPFYYPGARLNVDSFWTNPYIKKRR